MSEDVERVPRHELNLSRREVMGASAVASGAVLSGAMPTGALAQSDPSNEISGTVTDVDGNAVDGATVIAVPHDNTLDPLVATTDANGAYSFLEADLYAGDNLYHVVARNGTQSSPQRSQENYPFLLANGGAAIPDSGLLHDYNVLDLSASDTDTIQTFPDSQGTNDLTGGDPIYRASAINGNPALEFDDTDDSFSGSAFLHGDNGEEYTFHIVYVYGGGGNIETVFSSGDGNGISYRIRGDQTGDEREIGVTGIGSDTDGSATTSAEVVSARRSASNAVDMLVNGSSATLDSDTSPNQASGSGYIGVFDGTSRFWDNLFGRLLWYDQRQSDTDFQDTHSTLRGEWGV